MAGPHRPGGLAEEAENGRRVVRRAEAIRSTTTGSAECLGTPPAGAPGTAPRHIDRARAAGRSRASCPPRPGPGARLGTAWRAWRAWAAKLIYARVGPPRRQAALPVWSRWRLPRLPARRGRTRSSLTAAPPPHGRRGLSRVVQLAVAPNILIAATISQSASRAHGLPAAASARQEPLGTYCCSPRCRCCRPGTGRCREDFEMRERCWRSRPSGSVQPFDCFFFTAFSYVFRHPHMLPRKSKVAPQGRIINRWHVLHSGTHQNTQTRRRTHTWAHTHTH